MKKTILAGLWILIIGLGANTLFAQEVNPQIQKGIEYHNRARSAGEKNPQGLIEDCLALLKPFTQTDAIASAVYGSALTVKASFLASDNPMKSLGFLEKGNQFIDKAVAMDSKNVFCRLLRLENGIEVSRTSPLKRYGIIKSDVEFFIDEGKIEQLSDCDKAEAYLYCAFFYLDSGDLDTALELFEEAAQAAPESESGKRAKKMLDIYSE